HTDSLSATIHATITDGVAIGHPCCGVHNCHTPLTFTHNHFCSQHQDLNAVCAVTGCHLKA
ncbi:hypothetical protein DACRYDRAFT_47134, partial [Dacryopinax primogenitus]